MLSRVGGAHFKACQPGHSGPPCKTAATCRVSTAARKGKTPICVPDSLPFLALMPLLCNRSPPSVELEGARAFHFPPASNEAVRSDHVGESQNETKHIGRKDGGANSQRATTQRVALLIYMVRGLGWKAVGRLLCRNKAVSILAFRSSLAGPQLQGIPPPPDTHPAFHRLPAS